MKTNEAERECRGLLGFFFLSFFLILVVWKSASSVVIFEDSDGGSHTDT